MSVTAADVRIVIHAALDVYIRDHVAALETEIRANIAATGPEDEHASDRPPDPDSAWRCVSVEVLMRETARLEIWRDVLLERFDRCP